MKKIFTLLFSLLATHASQAAFPGKTSFTPFSKPTTTPNLQIHENSKCVVLVHGFMETGTAFKSLKKRLEKQGYICLVPKLSPMDGRGGLEGLAQGLKQAIDKAYGPTREITIIGFSMGGVVSRYYLKNLGGASRCKQLFTISSPHHGTKTAWLYPTKGAEQMRPNSPFLTELNHPNSHLQKIPTVTYRSPLDLMILPSESSILPGALNLSHPALLHPLMLVSDPVLSDIECRLATKID
ncbi:MAG: lipase [Gloeobacteraceae cyanobacterium ES-bin-144]|nr:lipase [Verrucomicrobiales bacterium]